MYHAIVKSIAKKNFERINQRDFDSLLKDCVQNVRHLFGGTHALGGERNDREALGRWLSRLSRLSPSSPWLNWPFSDLATKLSAKQNLAVTSALSREVRVQTR